MRFYINYQVFPIWKLGKPGTAFSFTIHSTALRACPCRMGQVFRFVIYYFNCWFDIFKIRV